MSHPTTSIVGEGGEGRSLTGVETTTARNLKKPVHKCKVSLFFIV